MRETESHLFPGWAKAQRVVAMVKEGPGCLSPVISVLQLEPCMTCVAMKPKLGEGRQGQVQDRHFWGCHSGTH